MKNVTNVKKILVVFSLIIVMFGLSFAVGPIKDAVRGETTVHADSVAIKQQVANLNDETNSYLQSSYINTGLIEELQTGGYLKPNSFVVKTYTLDNQSIAKSNYSTLTLTSAATLSGYTAKGIVGWNISNATTDGTGGSYSNVIRLYQSGSTVTALVRNQNSSSAIKVKMTVYVLFVKNT